MFNDQLFKKQLIKSLLITGSIVLMLTAILFVLGNRISNISDRISANKGEINLRRIGQESLVLLEKDREVATRYINIIENTLPAKDELINFPREIKTMGDKAGISPGFTFGAESSPVGGAAAVSFQLSINGSLEQILNFFKEVERSRFLINIGDIDLIKSGGSFGGVLSGQVYFEA